MKRSLPPFPALRAFEAAARHLSFKDAAEELHVSRSAVSHQVKALEQYLGRTLFRRTTRGVALTAAGRAYLPALSDGLDRVATATEQLRAADLTGTLTVSTTPAFAARWLVPRLKSFGAAYPGVALRINTSLAPVDFARGDADLAVRFGQARAPGLQVEPLIRSEDFPVCSPALLNGRVPLREPDDLRHVTLLHDEYGDKWAAWLELAGATRVDPAPGPRFEHCNLVLRAAVEGQGVALGCGALVAADLAAGRLLRPFDLSLPPQVIYSLVYPEAWAKRPKLAAFRDWLHAQAATAAEPDETAQKRPALAAAH